MSFLKVEEYSNKARQDTLGERICALDGGGPLPFRVKELEPTG